MLRGIGLRTRRTKLVYSALNTFCDLLTLVSTHTSGHRRHRFDVELNAADSPRSNPMRRVHLKYVVNPL